VCVCFHAWMVVGVCVCVCVCVCVYVCVCVCVLLACTCGAQKDIIFAGAGVRLL
jgi:hypothetical protein